LFAIVKKTIIDLHGAVPEETILQGRKVWARVYDFLEGIIIRKANLVIGVSNSMLAHIEEKHHSTIKHKCVLPIFDFTITEPIESKWQNERKAIIYSGGSDKWQNVDLMLNVISKYQENYNFTILTGDLETFKLKLIEKGLDKKVFLTSVSKNEVYAYYKTSDFGFLLRDESVVNSVSCPTKLVEYMSYGVIPIVLQPQIGDFQKKGFSYILLDRLHPSSMPESNTLRKMQMNNYSIVEELKLEAAESIKKLLKEVEQW
jgi:hypothetical protein